MKADDALLFMRIIDIPYIVKEVSKAMDIPIENIMIKSRKREFVTARQISMKLAKKYTPYSLSKIGNEIGNKDHATVLHACKTIDDLLDCKDSFITATYGPLDKKLEQLKKDIKSEKNSNKSQEKTIFNTEK